MPKAPREKKQRNYNNGGGQTSQKSWWEVLVNGRPLRVSRGKSRKTRCRTGWS